MVHAIQACTQSAVIVFIHLLRVSVCLFPWAGRTVSIYVIPTAPGRRALRPRRRKRPWRTPTASATARGERRARADAARGGHRWETGHLRAQESKRVVKMVGLGVLMWSSFQAAKVGEELCEIPVFKSGNQGIWMGLGTGPPAPQLFGERTS